MFSVDYGEVERYVMTFDAPAPGIARLRIPKNAQKVELGIASRAFPLLHFTQNRIEAHDRRRSDQAWLSKTGAHQRISQQPLRRVELLERNSFAISRNVVPVEALLVFKTEGCF